MSRTNFKELLDAGVHFGHLKRKWNPNIAPYIFMERNGIHIIDLEKTVVKIDEAAAAMKQIAKSGRKILFVATKKQAKDIVAEKVKSINMPYVTERWPGGMLTNFPTIRKAVKKMSAIDKMSSRDSGSIADLTRLPAALFVVDVSKEYIAVREAKRLTIPVFGMVDTNSDPTSINFPIPANDDASKSIALIIDILTNAVQEGLEERKMEKEKETPSKEKKAVKKPKDEKKQEQESSTKGVEEETADSEKPESKGKEKEKADAGEEKSKKQEKKNGDVEKNDENADTPEKE